MASADARPRVDHTGLYRGILAIAAVAVPAFGAVRWSLDHDSFAVRLAFSGVSLAAIAASYRWEAARRHLRLGPVLLCYALFLWFVHVGVRHDMTMEDVVGLLPIVSGAAVVVRRVVEVFVLIAVMGGVLVVAYQFMATPAVPIDVPFAVFTVFAGVLGWMSVRRTDLEEALQVANATLEARVGERTARLELEVAERVAAERRASAANEAKSRFLANMSHELRTPLNAVIGYTELVEQELAGTDQAHHCADLEKVGRSARHLLRIIDDVLDLSRVEAGQRPLGRGPVAVHAAAAEAAVLVQPAVDAHANRLALAVAPELAVVGDHDALVRVLVHLLDNAAKFTRSGTIVVAAVRRGDEVAIEVRDTGIGIPAAARAHVFERFTQADDSSTRLHGGVGLGLAICRELVLRMRGKISVASAVGEGSTFTVRLPVA